MSITGLLVGDSGPSLPPLPPIPIWRSEQHLPFSILHNFSKITEKGLEVTSANSRFSDASGLTWQFKHVHRSHMLPNRLPLLPRGNCLLIEQAIKISQGRWKKKRGWKEPFFLFVFCYYITISLTSGLISFLFPHLLLKRPEKKIFFVAFTSLVSLNFFCALPFWTSMYLLHDYTVCACKSWLLNFL